MKRTVKRRIKKEQLPPEVYHYLETGEVLSTTPVKYKWAFLVWDKTVELWEAVKDEILQKFDRCMAHANMPPEKQGELIEHIRALENAQDMTNITALLAEPAGKA